MTFTLIVLRATYSPFESQERGLLGNLNDDFQHLFVLEEGQATLRRSDVALRAKVSKGSPSLPDRDEEVGVGGRQEAGGAGFMATHQSP